VKGEIYCLFKAGQRDFVIALKANLVVSFVTPRLRSDPALHITHTWLEVGLNLPDDSYILLNNIGSELVRAEASSGDALSCSSLTILVSSSALINTAPINPAGYLASHSKFPSIIHESTRYIGRLRHANKILR
jgi:hypothetical protein